MRLTRRQIAAVGGGLMAIAAVSLAAFLLLRRPAVVVQDQAWTKLPRRVRIEVLNASKLPGAARIGRLALQHAGLDVVQSGNADSASCRSGSNCILVRLGDTLGVGRIIEVLGSADVVVQPDRTRIVDLTVVLGRNFVPPSDRFNSNPLPPARDP